MKRTANIRNSPVLKNREKKNTRGNKFLRVMSFLGGKVVYIAIIAGAIYVIGNFFAQQPYIEAKQTEMAKVQAEIEEAKKENERLKIEVDEMGTREYKEKVAREKLGLVKKGEKVFIDVEE